MRRWQPVFPRRLFSSRALAEDGVIFPTRIRLPRSTGAAFDAP